MITPILLNSANKIITNISEETTQYVLNKLAVKVSFALEHAMKAHRGSRDITLLIL